MIDKKYKLLKLHDFPCKKPIECVTSYKIKVIIFVLHL